MGGFLFAHRALYTRGCNYPYVRVRFRFVGPFLCSTNYFGECHLEIHAGIWGSSAIFTLLGSRRGFIWIGPGDFLGLHDDLDSVSPNRGNTMEYDF